MAHEMDKVVELKEALGTYFGLEKAWAMGLTAFGLVALALAIFLWTSKGAYRGAALPVALLALVETGVGAGIVLRTDRQVEELVTQVDAGADLRAERARMGRIVQSFEVAKVFEITLIGLGIAMTYGLRSRDFAFAAGVGLIAQCGTLLVFDLIAERRAEVYVSALGGPIRDTSKMPEATGS